MSRRPSSETATDGVSGGCVHFWRIESPNGRTSVGRCKYCGDTKEFLNSVHITGWERSSAATRKKAATVTQ